MGDNAATVRRVYDAFATGDVPTVLGAMDPKIDWKEPVSLPFDDQVGPDGVATGIFGKIFELFEEFSVNPSEVYAAGDQVFSTGVYRGRSKTGNQLEAEFVHHFGFGPDGKITYFHTHTDTKLWLDAIG